METSFNMFVETEVPAGEVIISRTDLKGVITYVNETFAEISGYDAEELIGQPHNILRHPDMPGSVFKELWDTIKSGEPWEGYVKNLRKDKGYYWVYARVSGVYKDGELVEYKSLRAFVTPEKRREMQYDYDNRRFEEGGLIRCVGYLGSETYRKLSAEAEKQGCSPEQLIEQKLSL